MKHITLGIAWALVFSPGMATAASLNIYSTHHQGTYSIYLSGGASNGAFNTISFIAAAMAPSRFTNLSSGSAAGIPLPAGEPMTYRSRILDAEIAEGGLGWTVLGVVTTATELAFTGGAPNGSISTDSQPFGMLFLANLRLEPSGSLTAFVRLTVAEDGFVVADLSAPLPFASPLDPNLVPEPATIGIGCLAALGIVAHRRRTSRPSLKCRRA